MQRSIFVVFILVIFSMFYLGCEQGMEPVSNTENSMKEFESLSTPHLILPPGTDIVSAELAIHVNNPWLERTVNIHRATADWDESTVTWNSFGSSFEISPIYGNFATMPGGWHYADITGLVLGWLDGTFPNFGLVLDQGELNYPRHNYSSKEGSNPPYLKITTGTGEIINIFPTDDQWIWELYPDNNHGPDPNLFTGWNDPNRLEKQTLIKFDISVEPEPECETVYAWGDSYATCFIDLGFGNWGWTNGLLSAGTYSFDVYAGAGQCDRTKGTYVGDVTVVYDGSDATVTYSMDAGFTMSEVHLFVGNEMLPRDKKGRFTNAPGKFTIVDDGLNNSGSETYTISGLSGDIYVVAHAVVCGNY